MHFAERLTCTIDEACGATGLGRTKLCALIGVGHLVRHGSDVGDWQ